MTDNEDLLAQEQKPAVSAGSDRAITGARTPVVNRMSPSSSAPAKAAAPKFTSRWDNPIDDDEDQGFFKKNRLALSIGGVAVVLGFGLFKLVSHSGGESGPRQNTVVMVSLPPPPPPPPVAPPPPPPPQMEEKKMEDAPMEAETQPDAPKDEPNEPPPGPATGIVGNGPPDGFGLRAGGGSGWGTGRGNKGGGSKFGWYAGQVQSSVQEALRRNDKTRSSSMRIEVRLWPDPATGRVTKATLGSSTGDSKLDSAIRDEVLTGLQLKEPPPQGMRFPIVMRVTARRP